MEAPITFFEPLKVFWKFTDCLLAVLTSTRKWSPFEVLPKDCLVVVIIHLYGIRAHLQPPCFLLTEFNLKNSWS